MKKKIIFVTQALWIGGIETALVNLLNHMDYEKYEITCLITKDYQDMADRITGQCRLLVADRRKTVSFEEPYRFAGLSGLMEEPQTASCIRRMIWKGICLCCRAPEMRLYSQYIGSQLRHEHFDTAVIYSDRVAEIAVRAINADRFLMFYHNADLGRAYHDIYGYRASEKVIAVSEAQCRQLQKKLPQYASRMIAVHNYVDVETSREKASQFPATSIFPDAGIRLVSCGRLAWQKGFDIAIEACAKVVEAGYDNLHWYILGVGPEKQKLEQLIRTNKMTNHFHLIGSKTNPYPYMKAADLYVQPSRTEGYSLSILEARALACPIVATYAAAEEQLTDGVTGTLCNTSAEAISCGIIRHLRNPQISQQYRLALESYSFSKENQDILKKIESLL